ncbi:MAG: hypothetical protein K2Y18_09300 [Alphaproteobacteria bacterium]|nr:hypothetical protein [Alphaproteobacteria bacterium]
MRFDTSFLNDYDVLLDYKTSLENQKNDVVFIGDSSGLMGVIPKVIKEELGINVINLATLGNAGIIGYDVVLRKYLEKNTAPKLIVFYISPSIPNSYISGTFEQIFAYTRYGKLDSLVENFGEHNILQIHSAIVTYILEKIKPTKDQDTLKEFRGSIERDLGYQRSLPNVAVMAPKARINSRHRYGDYFHTSLDPRKKIQKLVDHFSNAKTKVIVYIAPMPEGEEAFDYFTDIYKDIAANQTYKLPNTHFSDYTHLEHEGATLNSKIVARFIKPLIPPSKGEV